MLGSSCICIVKLGYGSRLVACFPGYGIACESCLEFNTRDIPVLWVEEAVVPAITAGIAFRRGEKRIVDRMTEARAWPHPE